VDKAPQIFANAIEFQEQITGTILALTKEENKQAVSVELEGVFANIATYNTSSATLNSNHQGEFIVGRLGQSKGCDVRTLKGKHDELRIMINTIPRTTIDQEYIRSQTENKAQVFALDAHHLVQLANIIGKTDGEKTKALLSMVVYTLATAATLTDGTLPVDVIKSQESSDYYIF
jgi:hypothetical protein